ncbi:MAG TPA: DUF4160 domain-containing protein [Devosia sp.]|jgi:hypothetical protein|uniref:DUF4160 domain-containing protein n=1 Tax=Devosia sp. TaxID=1871048 RepID=UPI002F93F480
MPTIIRLGNVKIAVYAMDHPPPHFHVLTADYAATISIRTLKITAGDLPSDIYRLVTRWADDHTDMLLDAWTRLNG